MTRENIMAKAVLDECFKIHRIYGPGLFESVYERLLIYELERSGFDVASQVPISIQYDDLIIPAAFRADLIVEDCLLLELKSIEQLPKTAFKQVLTYLKLADLKLGYLINFNVTLMKDGVHRIVNNL